jgi:hypothetical protein
VVAIVQLALLAFNFARGEPYGSVNDVVIVVQYFAGFAADPVSSPALASAWSTSQHDRPSSQKCFLSLSRSVRLPRAVPSIWRLLLITGYMGRQPASLVKVFEYFAGHAFVGLIWWPAGSQPDHAFRHQRVLSGHGRTRTQRQLSSRGPLRSRQDNRGHGTKTVRDREAPGSNPGPPDQLADLKLAFWNPNLARTGRPHGFRPCAIELMAPTNGASCRPSCSNQMCEVVNAKLSIFDPCRELV